MPSRLALTLAAVLLALAAPASARLVTYTSDTCEQGGGEPHRRMFGPPACASSVWVAQVDGSSPRRVTTGYQDDFGMGGDGNPIWTPDGTRIVYERGMPGTGRYGMLTRLWSVRPDGSDARPLTAGGDYDRDSGAVFSPDGLTIAFTSSRTGDLQNPDTAIFTIAAGGGDAHQVSGGQGIADAPLWSPDGSRLLYFEQEAALEPAWSGLYSATPLGGDRQTAAAGEAIPRTTLLSPDGRFLVWATPSFATAAIDLRRGSAAIVAPAGATPVRFEEEAPSILRLHGPHYEPDRQIDHFYDMDLAAPGRPHVRLPAGVPDGPQQPDLVQLPAAAALPVVVSVDDPYPPFLGGPAPPDPWDDEPSSPTRPRSAPATSTIRTPFAYTALAFAGLRSVSYSLGRRLGRGRCAYFTGRRFLVKGRCGRAHYRRIVSPTAWQRATARLPHGTYELRYRAVDRRGRASRQHKARIVRR